MTEIEDRTTTSVDDSDRDTSELELLAEQARRTTAADDPDEDTFELELTAEQALGLSQAAEGAQTTAPPIESMPGSSSLALPSPKPRLQVGGATRFRLRSLPFAAAIVGIMVAIAWWGTTQRAAERNLPTPAVVPLAPTPHQFAPPPAPPAEPHGPPVQVRNPFDAKEVFEFPAGTSKTEAQQRTADLLLQRARERRRGGIQHAGSRHPTRGNPAAVAGR